MDTPTINLDASVHESCTSHPKAIDVMVSLGFAEITKPGRLQTIGRMMTIRKGAKARGVDLDEIVRAFHAAGFSVLGYSDSAGTDLEPKASASETETEAASLPDAACMVSAPAQLSPQARKLSEAADELATREGRQARLQRLVHRLNSGEALEAVRADFVRDFASVSGAEIAIAEQNLLASGVPIREVQQLCDVHSALFHGHTDAARGDIDWQAQSLPEGHPILTLVAENEVLLGKLDALAPLLAGAADHAGVAKALGELKTIRLHYSKKQQLLMPIVYQAGFSGPSEVMWAVDDQIVRESRILARRIDSPEALARYLDRAKALSERMREMVYKEEQIFLPICLEVLTEQQWFEVYEDFDEFFWPWTTERWEHGYPTWPQAEAWISTKLSSENQQREQPPTPTSIKLTHGELTPAQINAIFDRLPVDLTFIDASDTTRFFTNEGRVFARPRACLGRDIEMCHPPRVIPMMRNLLDAFRAKRRTEMERWIDRPDDPVRVLYMPLYTEAGEYMGTLEMVQKTGPMKAHFEGKTAEKPSLVGRPLLDSH